MKSFGKRSGLPKGDNVAIQKAALDTSTSKQATTKASLGGKQSAAAVARPEGQPSATKVRDDLRGIVVKDLFDSVDLTAISEMDVAAQHKQINEFVRVILSQHQSSGLSMEEQESLVAEICNDVLGLGPLESLLARDDISDIMVDGPNQVWIEVNGRLVLTDIKFRDEAQLINICRKIVSTIGRRIDESSPICDARLQDGSRVAIVAPPIALDGTSLTIRKFKKDKLTLEDLIRYGSISKIGADIIRIASTSRCNILVSGGTGSGKTTLLNCLTRYIDPGEAIITCEDAAELQLQQPNVRRWETRPPNLEGTGAIKMTDLVTAALRHRPDRIIIGEIRGKEAFDLLQAMNTGHDGSAGTVHANNPREAIGRVESMIAMGGYTLPTRTVREQISSSIDIIIQAQRMRDGTRKITHISEVLGMEQDVVTLQDLYVYDHIGEDMHGNIIGKHRSTGLRPNFIEKARYYGLDNELLAAMQEIA